MFITGSAAYQEQVLFSLSAWSAVNVVLLLAGYVAAGQLRATFPKSNRWELADLIGSTPIFVALAAMALLVANDLGDSAHGRWLGRSALGHELICCYVARQVVSFPLVYCSGFKPPDQARARAQPGRHSPAGASSGGRRRRCS